MTSRDPKGAGGSTVGYPSDSLASCFSPRLAYTVGVEFNAAPDTI